MIALKKYADLCIEALTGYGSFPGYGDFPGYGNFQDMEGLVQDRVEIPVEIQDMEIFQNLEAKHYTQYIVKPLV